MKKILPAFILLLILSACGGQTVTPASEWTATPLPVPSLPPAASFSGLPSNSSELPPNTILPTRNPKTSPPPAPTETAVTIRFSPIDGMPQVFIPAGTFFMGGFDVRAAPDEFPNRQVTLDAYWMDQLEVTNAMYQLCVSAGGCTPPQKPASQRRDDYYNNPEFKDYPVVYVTWEQAKAYCEWAGRRLPSEAEWERAARGNDMRTFPWGEDKPDYRFANFNFIVKDTSRVGTYSLGASPFGIFDMAGNVAEWTNDFYSSGYYAIGELTNPLGPLTSTNYLRVVRGGSLGDAEVNIRISKRSAVQGPIPNTLPGSPESLGAFSPRIGFRCAQDE
ncbi:MAG: formylglycine-generating enzyme family protein [Chloroflexota bacterium]